MLDLNLKFVNDDETTPFRDVEESGTSNSSVVNADGMISSNAGDGNGDGEEDSSSVGAGESLSCYNFDILKVGDAGAQSRNTYNEDNRNKILAMSEFVTRRLFPVSQGEESGRLIQANSLLLCPNTNELQEITLVQVQQPKPNVQPNLVGKKSRRGPRSRSSQYRGVTFYRRTGRWESHIWDCGKQVYLGGFDTAHAAARAYDQAAIKFRGVDADINFNLSDYEEDMNQLMMNFSKEEFVHVLRRQSTGFSRGNSKYRGRTLHKYGRWEGRMGQPQGKNAYDKAAIECNGIVAVTNFETSTYDGNNHNLNLSLGISSPSVVASSRSSQKLEQACLNYEHDTPRLQLENPVSALKGPPSWSHVYPTFVPNHEEGATDSRAMAGSSQGPPYWGWKLHGHHTHNDIPTAASSGFLASAATSGSQHTRDTIVMAPLNNHYSPLTPATSSSQYYYQLKPSPSRQPPP